MAWNSWDTTYMATTHQWWLKAVRRQLTGRLMAGALKHGVRLIASRLYDLH